MAGKQLNARVITKHDKEENWNKATSFIPKLGELIVYETDGMYSTPRLKVGNGLDVIKKLPFITDAYVVKESGKGLSSNDFTDFLRQKLINIPNDAKFTDTTYTAGAGLGLDGTKFYNKSLVSIGPGQSNGTVKVSYRIGPNETPENFDNGEFKITGLTDTAFTTLDTLYSKIKNGTQEGTINVNGNDISITGLNEAAFMSIQELSGKILGEAAQEVYVGQNIEENGSAKIWIKEELDTGLMHLYYYDEKESSFTEFETSNVKKIEEATNEGPGTFRVVTFNQNESYIIHIVPDIQLESTEVGIIKITKGDEASFRMPIMGLINDPEHPEFLAFLPLTGGTITGLTSFTNTTAATSITTGAVTIAGGLGVAGDIYCNLINGSTANDYAEYRSQNEEIQPGYITYCDDDGKLKLTTEFMQKFEGVVSDTFGFSIGKDENNQTPIAVSGRVLVYCNPEEHFHSGDCVCAGPNGLAYRMTREEIIEFPDRIVGIVSEIPTYEYWGPKNIKTDGRIWIRVK